MNLHKDTWHKKYSEVECQFPVKSLFSVHNESSWAHLKTKKYIVKTFDCSHCDKKFGLFCDKNVWNLKTWIHKKYGVKTFDCSHCDKKFSLTPSNYNWKKSFLKKHEIKWNVPKSIFFTFTEVSKSAENLLSVRPYKCDKCKRTCFSALNFAWNI